MLPTISLEIYTQRRRERDGERRGRGEGAGTGEEEFSVCTLKNGECQNEIKKNVERESGREREAGESKSR